MSFATKHAKSKLSSRLTRVYAFLFSAIFFLLSCIVFLLAFRFLVQQQYDHLVNSLELYSNTIKEEFREEEVQENEGSDESSEEDSEREENSIRPELLQDLAVDSNLSVYLYDREGTLLSRTQSIPLPERIVQADKSAPELIFYDHTMLLRASSTLSDQGTKLGSLVLVYRMTSETGFLRLLAQMRSACLLRYWRALPRAGGCLRPSGR